MQAHNDADLFSVGQEPKQLAPESLDAFDPLMLLNKFSQASMFVGRKAVIDDYCGRLFGILFA